MNQWRLTSFIANAFEKAELNSTVRGIGVKPRRIIDTTNRCRRKKQREPP
jgi:hypothetical protein